MAPLVEIFLNHKAFHKQSIGLKGRNISKL